MKIQISKLAQKEEALNTDIFEYERLIKEEFLEF